MAEVAKVAWKFCICQAYCWWVAVRNSLIECLKAIYLCISLPSDTSDPGELGRWSSQHFLYKGLSLREQHGVGSESTAASENRLWRGRMSPTGLYELVTLSSEEELMRDIRTFSLKLYCGSSGWRPWGPGLHLKEMRSLLVFRSLKVNVDPQHYGGVLHFIALTTCSDGERGRVNLRLGGRTLMVLKCPDMELKVGSNRLLWRVLPAHQGEPPQREEHMPWGIG